MAHVNTVIRSINQEGGNQCVDVFRRPDGTYGYELYRRDPEDGRGWYPIGGFADHVFASDDAALERARGSVPWLTNSEFTARS